MVFDVSSLSKADGAQQFDTYLADFSYVGGYTPSQADVEALTHFKEHPDAKLENLSRWWRHVSSFSNDEKASFPGATASGESKKEAEEDFDLFGEGDEEEYEKELERRRKEAEEKSGKKKKELVAKSSVIFDVKPWDDNTDMKAMEESVRTIEMEGLLWGAAKLVDVAYGVKKLVINAVIVDDLVSTEDIEEKIKEFEDYVQSVDIAAFNKI